MPYMRKQAPAQVPFLTQYMKRLKTRGMGQDSSGTDTIVDPTTGDTYDLSGNLLSLGTSGPAPLVPSVTSQITYPVSTTTPSSNGLNLTNLLNSITTAAVNGTKIYQTLQGPSLVAGTQAIYNPATGQYYNPTTGQVVNAPGTPGTTSTLFPAGLSSSSLSSILLIGGIGLAAVLVIGMVNK